MTLAFEPVEINDTGVLVPEFPDHEWEGQLKAEFGKTAAGDTKIALEWTITADPSGEYEEKIGKVAYQTIVVRPTGHIYERMFLKDIYAIADKYELERPKGWDGLVAFVAELDGLKGMFGTQVDKKGESRVVYKTTLRAVDADEEDEKPVTRKASPAAKKSAKKR